MSFLSLPECIKRKLPRNYKGDNNKIKVERKITKRGSGYGVNLPPILIEKLGLINGVLLEESENSIIITALNRKDGKENE